MASLEQALLLDLVYGAPTGRRLLPHVFATFKDTGSGPDTLVLNGPQLDHLRRLLLDGDAVVAAALEPIVEKARFLSLEAPASVRDKTSLQVAAAPNDYVSLAKYWWPVSLEDGSIVYERRDGAVNPDCFGDQYDFGRMTKMANDTLIMALAAYFTADDQIGAATANRIKTWFLDAETAQTPHFSFSQIVPGKKDLSGRGTIEIRYLIQTVDAIRLIHHCNYIDDDQLGALRTWFARLLDWLLDSEVAKRAASSGNNISVWYWTSSYVFARFAGDEARGEKVLASVADLISLQVAEDGSLPAEMARARSHDYTAFSLLGLSLLEASAARHHIDVLTAETEQGRALTAARDWLLSTEEAFSIRATLTALTSEDAMAGESESAFDALTLKGMLDATRRAWQADQKALRTSKVAAGWTLERASHIKERLAAEDEKLKSLRANLTKVEAALEKERREKMGLAAEVEKLKSLRANLTQVAAALEQKRREKMRLRRQRNYLALPYLLLTAPMSLPLLYWRERRRKIKSRSKSFPADVAGSGSGGKNRDEAKWPFRFAIKKTGSGKPPAEFYGSSPVDDEPDTYVLYRIIGNDLVPRHELGQSRTNLEFILDHEAEFENCEKRFIVNRIHDPHEEERIVELLEARGQTYSILPFDFEAYRAIQWDFGVFPNKAFFDSDAFRKLEPLEATRAITAAYRLKNLYVMNNNGARNAALNEGRTVAKWVLPWDGNCFVTPCAWADLIRAVEQDSQRRYFAVPMQRITENIVLLQDDFAPDPQEEPQMLFRKDAGESFNPAFPYGRRPKVELFWRLGLPGHWDKWRDDPWEVSRRGLSREAGMVGTAGWVARLASGVSELEQQGDIGSFKMRGWVRSAAIMTTIDHVDAKHSEESSFPCFYRKAAIKRVRQAFAEAPKSALGLLAADLVARAEAALGDGEFSVVDKTTRPPSNDIHDYWTPAPYWWPNPKTASGLPFVRKDGERVPGTRMYEPDSERYDRTRLQRMFDNTTLCALAAEVSGRQAFAEHGARLVRRWFLDPESRMNPHLDYAQVRMGHNGNKGNATGIIEFKDVYYFLDAVRLLARSGALGSAEVEAFTNWLEQYRTWLEGSDQGRAESLATNNHGTYYDLQSIAISAFLNDNDAVRICYFRALSRLERQIEADGRQPDELKRTLTQHYVVFNLQGFLNVFRIARACGRPLLGAEADAERMKRALHWILSQDHDSWPYEQLEPFEKSRLFPLVQSAQSLGIVSEQEVPGTFTATSYLEVQPVFNPHFSIHPFWNIGRP